MRRYSESVKAEVPATQKDPEGLGPADKLTVVLETAGLNSTELGAYCRERGLLSEQVTVGGKPR